MFNGKTLAEIQAEKGFTTGFDYLRIVLAIAVLSWHSFPLTYGRQIMDAGFSSAMGPVLLCILCSFFALSGFLVAGSLERHSLPGFMSLRALRIFPALAVEILLSALILGPIMTQVPLTDYFRGADFFKYFLNIIGHIHYTLPGVFESNPWPSTVNGSLWTIPYELECYLALSAAFLFGLYRRRALFAGVVTAAAILMSTVFYVVPVRTPLMNGRALIICFLVGVTIYLWRDRITHNRALALIAAALTYLLLRDIRLMPLAAFPAAYLTVYIGMTTPRLIGLLKTGDYSYGMYLFAFPIQQTLEYFPALRAWWIIAPLTVVLSAGYAAFSWHCVEKPVLARKKAVVNFIDLLVTDVRLKLSGLVLRR